MVRVHTKPEYQMMTPDSSQGWGMLGQQNHVGCLCACVLLPKSLPRVRDFVPARVGLAIKLLRLLLYAYGQHVNVLKHFVYVKCGS
jgi:hypothetical protein